jgi:hypothetical protein
MELEGYQNETRVRSVEGLRTMLPLGRVDTASCWQPDGKRMREYAEDGMSTDLAGRSAQKIHKCIYP